MKKLNYTKLILIILIISFITPLFTDSLHADSPIQETFGYDIAGGSSVWIGYADPVSLGFILRGATYTVPKNGTLISLHAYIQMPYGEGRGYDLEMGIYEEDFYGNNSHRLVAKEKEKNLDTSGWKTVHNFGENIIAGTRYILVAIARVYAPLLETVQIDLAYDDIGTNNYYEQGLWGRWLDPWNRVPVGTGRNYSIYATYEIIPPIEPIIELTFEQHQFFMVLLFVIWVCISIVGYKKDDVLLLYVQFFVLLPLVLMLLSDAFLKGTVLGYGVGFCLLFSSIYFVLLGTLMARNERTKHTGRKPHDRIYI